MAKKKAAKKPARGKPNKTTQTEASVEEYIANIPDVTRRADCEALAKLMSAVTRQPPKTAEVGFVLKRHALGRQRHIHRRADLGNHAIGGVTNQDRRCNHRIATARIAHHHIHPVHHRRQITPG